jgi:hypothetical protein
MERRDKEEYVYFGMPLRDLLVVTARLCGKAKSVRFACLQVFIMTYAIKGFRMHLMKVRIQHGL